MPSDRDTPDAQDTRDVLARIDAVRRACVDAGEQDPLDEAADLRLKHHGLDGIGAWTADAGFALRRGDEVDLAVAPDARGHGTGGDLAGSALAAPGALTAWSHGDHPAAARLAVHHGLERARELWVMRRPTSEPLPPLTLPDDVTVRGFRDADADAVLAVNAAAFAAHPEQGDLDADGLAARMAEPWWDPAGLLVARLVAPSGGGGDGGDVLGFHWTKQHDADLGEVYVVGVSPQAQGRGLGRLLTLAGLHHLERAGVREVLLYVERDNAPAVRLYRGLGFTHTAADTHVQYQR